MLTLKAIALALLLALPSSSPSLTDGESKGSKSKEVMVDDDTFAFDFDEDPVVVHVAGLSGRGRIGVRLVDLTPDLRAHFGAPRDAGVMVAAVESGSAAAKAGVAVGDIITAADSERIESPLDLSRAIRRRNPGETLKLDVARDRATKHLTVTVEETKGSELAQGPLGHNIRQRVLRDLEPGHPGIERDRGRLEEKLDNLEKRLDELEKRLAR